MLTAPTPETAAEAPRDPILTQGMTHEVVPAIQKLLSDLGHYTGPLGTTDVNDQLLAAVNSFRRAYGIADDPNSLPPGADPSVAIGPATWKALHTAADGYVPTPTPPAPAPAPAAALAPVASQQVQPAQQIAQQQLVEPPPVPPLTAAAQALAQALPPVPVLPAPAPAPQLQLAPQPGATAADAAAALGQQPASYPTIDAGALGVQLAGVISALDAARAAAVRAQAILG